MGIRFRIKHYPEAAPAHRFRYAIVHSNGNEMVDGEGYPTHQHVVRAIRGLLKGMAKLFGIHPMGSHQITGRGFTEEVFGPDFEIPFTKDSYKPPRGGTGK